MKLLSRAEASVELWSTENVELGAKDVEPDGREPVTEILVESPAEDVSDSLPDDEVNGKVVDAVTVGTSTAEPTLEIDLLDDTE